MKTVYSDNLEFDGVGSERLIVPAQDIGVWAGQPPLEIYVEYWHASVYLEAIQYVNDSIHIVYTSGGDTPWRELVVYQC